MWHFEMCPGSIFILLFAQAVTSHNSAQADHDMQLQHGSEFFLRAASAPDLYSGTHQAPLAVTSPNQGVADPKAEEHPMDLVVVDPIPSLEEGEEGRPSRDRRTRAVHQPSLKQNSTAKPRDPKQIDSANWLHSVFSQWFAILLQVF